MAAVTEVLAEITNANRNFYLLHIDTFAQAITLTGFYYFLNKNRLTQRLLIIGFVLFVLIALTEILFIHGWNGFNSLAKSFLSLIMGVSSFLLLLRIKNNPKYVNVHLTPVYWVCSGLLIFYITNFTLFFFGFELSNRPLEYFREVYLYFLSVLIAVRVFISIGLWKVSSVQM